MHIEKQIFACKMCYGSVNTVKIYEATIFFCIQVKDVKEKLTFDFESL